MTKDSKGMLPCSKITRDQERLTPEQEAYARQFAQEHIARMLATTAIDEQEAETHLREVYQVAGREPPVTIHWFDSPIALAPLRVRALESYVVRARESDVVDKGFHPDCSMIEDVDGLLESVRHSVWTRVWHSVEESVRDSVWPVRFGVANSLAESMRASVQRVYSMVDGCGLDSLSCAVEDSVRAYSYANDLVFYQFFHEVFEENSVIHMALFNEMVSGYRLEWEEAWLVRKPIMLERDEQGQLHSASGRCIQYRDGWGFYAWHGVRVPEKLILHPEEITREDWMKAENVEVRRVIQERLSPERFVEMVGGTCIDKGRRGELIEVDLGDDDPEAVAHYVRVTDASTSRQYYLQVPPLIRRADEAVAWTFGLDEQDYEPRQET